MPSQDPLRGHHLAFVAFFRQSRGSTHIVELVEHIYDDLLSVQPESRPRHLEGDGLGQF